jgi:hypothetical protein
MDIQLTKKRKLRSFEINGVRYMVLCMDWGLVLCGARIWRVSCGRW